MTRQLRVLILEDSPNDAELIVQELRRAGFEPDWRRVDNEADYIGSLNDRFDVVLSDFAMPGFGGTRALELLKKCGLETPFIIVSGMIGEDAAVQAMRNGAADYLLKDRIARLGPAIEQVVEQNRLRQEKNAAQQALLDNEELFRKLNEFSPLGIMLLDNNGRCTYCNPRGRDIFKTNLGEIVGMGWVHDCQPSDMESVIKDWLVALREGREFSCIFALRSPSQQVRWVSARSSPIFREASRAQGHAVTIEDITESKEAEEQLKASFKEVADLNAEIQKFYHTLSHELKTPLTSAREFVSIVMDGLAGPLNETQLEYLGIAKESCDQLRLYINDLLDVTRLETGKMSIEFHEMPLAGLLERVVKMLAPAAAGKGVKLSCDCQAGLPVFPIDQHRTLQVLTNLTTNAIKFTPEGGHILLSLSEAPLDPGCLKVTVRDTGRGIPGEYLDTIFDRLSQVEDNSQPVESRNGLGLGLYICQELVGLHGGRIWAESEIGKGSTFSFVIPKEAMTKGAHVLIVDDDFSVREALRIVLEDQNFEVTTAEDGNEALQMMGQKTPAVVVLDLLMNRLDGPSTLKEIRMNWGHIPVIVYTGYPDSVLMGRVMEFSPFTLLAKPCPPKRFVETVRRMCHTGGTRFLKKCSKVSQVC